MSQAQCNQIKDEAVLSHLSEEFGQVVERIQEEVRDFPLGTLEPDALAQVEAAEEAVDARALDFQQGAGDQTAWKAALSDYETVWLQVVLGLGERQN